MQNQPRRDPYRTSRLMYIIEAALEYFVSITVAGAYLAKITSSIGISDSLTGILSAIVSLGSGFQLIALFLAHRRPVKRWVTALHTISQICFSCLYLTPLIPIGRVGKTVVFVVLLLVAYILHNTVNSPKINWYMSLVDNDKRGVFTANKEIISLLSGMIFSYAMGEVIDRFEAAGNLEGAFVVGAATLLILTLLHTLTLVSSKEKEPTTEERQPHPVRETVVAMLKNKRIVHVISLSVLWAVAHSVATPFYGTYEIKELGFSMTLVSVLGIVGSVTRALVSRPMGRFADKVSFFNMLRVCYAIAALAFAVNVFTAPANGRVLFAIYKILFAISMAGINSGVINLIYSEVETSQRTSALALQHCVSGVVGFLTTTLASLLVARIQEHGFVVFGTAVYAQQVVSLMAFLLTCLIVVVCRPLKHKNNKEQGES